MNKLRTTAGQGTESRQSQPGRTGRGRLVHKESCEIMISKAGRKPKRKSVIAAEGGVPGEKCGSTGSPAVDRSR